MLLYKNTVKATLTSGFAALDAELPGGGWPLGALCELLPRHVGIGELRLLGPALASLSAAGRSLAWIAPPHRPYAPALAAAGIDLARVLVVNRHWLRAVAVPYCCGPASCRLSHCAGYPWPAPAAAP
jgi:hypothetical protein